MTRIYFYTLSFKYVCCLSGCQGQLIFEPFSSTRFSWHKLIDNANIIYSNILEAIEYLSGKNPLFKQAENNAQTSRTRVIIAKVKTTMVKTMKLICTKLHLIKYSNNIVLTIWVLHQLKQLNKIVLLNFLLHISYLIVIWAEMNSQYTISWKFFLAYTAYVKSFSHMNSIMHFQRRNVSNNFST